MASTIPRIALEDLQCPYAFGCIATPAYVTAAENLAVGLARGGVAIVALPEACSADVLDSGLNALLLSDETSSLPGCEMREWRVGGPEDDGVEGVGAAAAARRRCISRQHPPAAGCRQSPAPNLHPLPSSQTPSPHQPYGLMESTARMLLSALCRSSLLRLRGDAFGGMLDDLPLSRSAQGSSLLAARRYVDNFSQLSAGESASVAPLFADPQVQGGGARGWQPAGAPGWMRRGLAAASC